MPYHSGYSYNQNVSNNLNVGNNQNISNIQSMTSNHGEHPQPPVYHPSQYPIPMQAQNQGAPIYQLANTQLLSHLQQVPTAQYLGPRPTWDGQVVSQQSWQPAGQHQLYRPQQSPAQHQPPRQYPAHHPREHNLSGSPAVPQQDYLTQQLNQYHPQQLLLQNVRQSPQQSPHQNVHRIPQQSPLQSIQHFPQQSPRQIVKQILQQSPHQSLQQIPSRQSPHQSLRQIPQHIPQQTAQPDLQQSPHQILQQVLQRDVLQPAQHYSRQPLQQYRGQPHQQASPTSLQQSLSRVVPQTHIPPARSVQSDNSTRAVSHVQIPVYKPKAEPGTSLEQTQMPRPSKRRKSNDGLDCELPIPQKRSFSTRPQQIPESSSPLTVLASSQLPPTPPQPALDYQAVLLSLSDEYIGAARNITGLVASGDATASQSDECHELLSLGMGCLHALLKTYRQPEARKEARIRLQLASLMFEETENDTDCAEVLTKGIAVCERSRLTDAKYGMQHLEVRLLFKTQPNAALKKLESLISEVVVTKSVKWTYVFRFLRISLGQVLSGTADVTKQLENTGAIISTARQRGHVAVLITAACLETLIYLRCGTVEAVESARRSLTVARTHQLGPEIRQLPQMSVLMDCLTLACNLVHFEPSQIDITLQRMQASLDAIDSGWKKNREVLIPLGDSAGPDIELDTAGIIKSINGRSAMAFQWLTRTQVMAIGYLISGLARMYNNTSDHKSEKYLKEVFNLHKAREDVPSSLCASKTEVEWRAVMSTNTDLLLMFALCDRSDWASAMRKLQILKKDLIGTYADITFDTGTIGLCRYLEAVIPHGLGEVEVASVYYRLPELCFNTADKGFSLARNCQVLATLSNIQILRSPCTQSQQQGDIQETQAQRLLADIEPYCRTHPNKSFQAAHSLLCSTTGPSTKESSVGVNPTLLKKKHLESAVRTAQVMKNSQIICMVLNLMRDAFFHNIIGTQAEQNGRAARKLAKKTDSPLWTATADAMLARTLELGSAWEEAAEVMQEAEAQVVKLPEEVKKRLASVHPDAG